MQTFWNVTARLLEGAGQAAIIFAVTLAAALPLGLLIAFCSMSRFRPLRAVSRTLVWIILAIVVALILVLIFLRFVPLGLWITSLAAGVHISIGSLIGMRLRRIQPKRLVEPLIKARKAGLDVTLSKLETHYLAGGNVDRVINALIAAQRSNIEMPFEKASAIDLAGRDVLQAVQMSVTPKVIETPVVAAIAKDGIELRAKARVTVRTNIERLVGGAGEETIIARVGEGIVTTVGSSETHKQVLENPDLISRTVLNKGLDAGTCLLYTSPSPRD